MHTLCTRKIRKRWRKLIWRQGAGDGGEGIIDTDSCRHGGLWEENCFGLEEAEARLDGVDRLISY